MLLIVRKSNGKYDPPSPYLTMMNEEAMQRSGVTQIMRQIGTGKFRSDLAVRTTEQSIIGVITTGKVLPPPIKSKLFVV